MNEFYQMMYSVSCITALIFFVAGLASAGMHGTKTSTLGFCLLITLASSAMAVTFYHMLV